MPPLPSPWTTWTQVTVFILCLIFGPCALGGICVIVYMLDHNPYAGLMGFFLGLVAMVNLIVLGGTVVSCFWIAIAMVHEWLAGRKQDP